MSNSEWFSKNDNNQWSSQAKMFLGKNFGGIKIFDFRLATVFLFRAPPLKTQNDYMCTNLAERGAKGYAYEDKPVFS